MRIEGGAVVDRQHALRPRGDRIQAGVRGDRVEPRAQRAAALELAERAPGAQQRVLERVLGVVHRPEHPVAVRVQLPAVRVDQASEGALVAPAGGFEEVALLRCGGNGHASFISDR